MVSQGHAGDISRRREFFCFGKEMKPEDFRIKRRFQVAPNAASHPLIVYPESEKRNKYTYCGLFRFFFYHFGEWRQVRQFQGEEEGVPLEQEESTLSSQAMHHK